MMDRSHTSVLTPSRRAYPGRVIFDHLPKTAGQAVNAWLRESLGSGCVTGNLIGRHRELIREFGGVYSIISGHVHFEGEGLDSRYDYVTCFRHPIDRAISWIYYVLENHSDQDIVELRKGVRLFIDSEGKDGAEYVQANNVMTNHLCSVTDCSFDPSQVDPKRVEHALCVLEQYALWGLYERLPDFIADFASWLGIPAPARLPIVGKTIRRPSIDQISPAIRKRLEELNSMDLALYERLVASYGLARRHWQRPCVTVSSWQPVPTAKPLRFTTPDFALLSVRHEGGRNVHPQARLLFMVDFSLAKPVQALECSIHIHDARDVLAFSTKSTWAGTNIGPLAAGTHQVVCSLVADLPQNSYKVGFTFVEINADGTKRILARLDRMVSFRVTIHRQPRCHGYVSLPIKFNHCLIGDNVVRLVQEGTGEVHFIDPVNRVLCGERWHQQVVLANKSSQDWQGTLLNPIRLSYRWLTMDRKIVVSDGERSDLPESRLQAKGSVAMHLAICAPAEPGSYLLQVLPVQEGHAWFDKLGFKAGERCIEVVLP